MDALSPRVSAQVCLAKLTRCCSPAAEGCVGWRLAPWRPRVSRFWLIMSRLLPRLRGRPGFLAGWPAQGMTAKSGGDDDPAELDGHVVVGGFGLRGVPAVPSPVTGHVIGAVTVQCVPDGDDAETDQPERHGPFDGATCPIAGLTHSDDVANVGEGLLDSQARCVAGHQVFRGRFEIGGHQWQPIPAVVSVTSPRFVVADQNHAHGSGAAGAAPPGASGAGAVRAPPR
jgi:hypothetical protein